MILINRTKANGILGKRDANIYIMYLDRMMGATKRMPITNSRGQLIWSNHYDLEKARDMLNKKPEPSAVVKRHIKTTEMLIDKLGEKDDERHSKM